MWAVRRSERAARLEAFSRGLVIARAGRGVERRAWREVSGGSVEMKY